MSQRSSGVLSGYRPGSTQELLIVALPLMISFGSQSLMQFVDRMFLTWYSQSAMAATMPAGLLAWTLMSIAYGIASYTGTFVAQYEGAGRKDRVAAVIWQAVWLSLLMGCALALLSLAAPALFRHLGHPLEIQRGEIIYFSTLIAGAPAVLLMTSLSGFFSGRNQTAIVMWINLAAVFINLLLDYVMIFGWGPFPEMGIFGAAIATVIANVIAMALFIVLVVLVGRWQNYPLWTSCSWDNALAARMIRYGLPVGSQTFVDISGFAVFTLIIGKLGVSELAATNLAFNLNALAFIPMLGLGIGVMTLVGRRVGEGNPALAEQTVQKALYLGWIYMGSWCIAYLFFPRLLLVPFAIYAQEEQFGDTIEIAIVLLRFVALFGLFDAMGLVYGYAIRGAGDSWYPLIYFFIASIFCLMLPLMLIWQYLDANLYACWAAATVYVFVIGIGMYLRFHSGRWKSMRVIESEPDLREGVYSL